MKEKNSSEHLLDLQEVSLFAATITLGASGPMVRTSRYFALKFQGDALKT
jgi:hypothetical protein